MKYQLYLLVVLLSVNHHFGVYGQEHHKYCIVGAGPAGLQLGYFMETDNRDYIIFDRSDKAGSFFEKMPRHGTLISVNKRYTGGSNTEFNMRHDWNSLLSNNRSLLMGKYSKKMFPHKDVLIKYLNDYQQSLNIKVKFNTDIRNIRRSSDNSFWMEDQHSNSYSCSVLVIATGMHVPFIPDIEGGEYLTGYEDVSIDPEDFEGKTVLILGKGNSAFEVAASIYGNTNSIHMMSRDRIRLSWATHYVGDLRAINNELLDTYQLKSLDGIFESNVEDLAIIKNIEGKMIVVDKNASESVREKQKRRVENGQELLPYDVIIRCLGFKFNDSLFNSSSVKVAPARVKKFPLIGNNYESPDNEDLYFAGILSHSVDFRKSAGGFIHGFRYTAQALYKLLDWRYEQVKWPHLRLPTTALLNHLIVRINEASGLYQMFSHLGDVVLFDKNLQSCSYLEEYPLLELHKIDLNTGLEVEGPILVFVYEYGKNFSGKDKDPFVENRADSSIIEAYKSNFLHPVLYIYNNLPTDDDMVILPPKSILPRPDYLHHTIENFNTNFRSNREHILPIRRFLENALNVDLTDYSAEACLYYALSSSQSPLSCLSNLPMASINMNPSVQQF